MDEYIFIESKKNETIFSWIRKKKGNIILL